MFNLNQPEANPALSFFRRYAWGPVAQRVLALLFAVGITVAIVAIRDDIQTYAVYGYPGVFLISLLGNATLIFPAPSWAVVLAVGGALNPYLAGVAAGLGAALGEMTGYLAGFGGRGVIEDRKYYHTLEGLVQRRGAWIIFALAAIPNPIFDVGGMMAGALKMPWWKFLGAAAAGKSIRFILLAMWGASLFGA
ncbi:MAG: DedA family protein [Caldilineae bacterium]|nr:MAG: DedA family protein [Caldilineae bacterium]